MLDSLPPFLPPSLPLFHLWSNIGWAFTVHQALLAKQCRDKPTAVLIKCARPAACNHTYSFTWFSQTVVWGRGWFNHFPGEGTEAERVHVNLSHLHHLWASLTQHRPSRKPSLHARHCANPRESTGDRLGQECAWAAARADGSGADTERPVPGERRRGWWYRSAWAHTCRPALEPQLPHRL